MSNIYSVQQALSEAYGQLGEAQQEQLAKLLETVPGFKDLPLKKIWRRVNEALADENYPQKNNMNVDMNELLDYGSRYATGSGSIYDGPVEDVDMNSLMDLYEEDGEKNF